MPASEVIQCNSVEHAKQIVYLLKEPIELWKRANKNIF